MYTWLYISCHGAPLLLKDYRYALLPDSTPQVFTGVCSTGHWRGHLSLQRSDCLWQSRGFLCSECWCLFSISSHRDAQLPERTRRTKQLCYPWDNGEIVLLAVGNVFNGACKMQWKLTLKSLILWFGFCLFLLSFGIQSMLKYLYEILVLWHQNIECYTC